MTKNLLDRIKREIVQQNIPVSDLPVDGRSWNRWSNGWDDLKRGPSVSTMERVGNELGLELYFRRKSLSNASRTGGLKR